MKKTLIAMMILCGAASADTVEYAPLTDTENWTHTTLRDGKNKWVLNDDATLTLSSSNWGQESSTYDLTEDLTAPFTFSVDITRSSSGQGVALFTLIGNTKAVTIGNRDYSAGAIYYGTTSTVDALAYNFGNEAWQGDGETSGDEGCLVSTTAMLLDAAFNYNATTTISGSTTLNDNGETMLTLSAITTANTNEGTVTINLGKGFVLDKIMLCGDGANNITNMWKVSNLSVEGKAVPEPTTATLSLLALAGLATRRRRK